MSTTTPTLGLVKPATGDAPSTLRTAISTNADALDGAVLTSDSRLLSAALQAALAGTSGTPGSGNKFVTDADPRLPSTAEKGYLDSITAFIATLLDDANAAAALATLGAQPLDSDLTAIAALSTTSFGRSLLAAADAAALRTLAAVVPPKGGTVNVTVPNAGGGFGGVPNTVVTHGLGTTPSMAMAQWSTSPPGMSSGGPRTAILACDTFTSTQFTIKGDAATNIVAGVYAVNWIAVA